jgi:hypothetical protein
MKARDYEIPEDFQAAADRFIELANEIAGDASRDWVRAVLMFAAARYNAFTWITRDDTPGQTLEQAMAYFRNEYETMLRENIKELTPVYSQNGAQNGAPNGAQTSTQNGGKQDAGGPQQ